MGLTYTEPLLAVFLGIALAGAICFKGKKASRIALTGLIGVFTISWPPLDWLFSRPLEARYPVRPFQPSDSVQAIVVLGSAFEPPHYERPYPLADPYTYARCMQAAWIYHQKAAPILACEGRRKSRAVSNQDSRMRSLLETLGVPANMIWVEGVSSSTHENALFGAEILRQHGVSRVALVVEAASMPRASACFQKLGIEILPAPSDFRQWNGWANEWMPGWSAIRHNEIILHESIGLLWYRMRGWI